MSPIRPRPTIFLCALLAAIPLTAHAQITLHDAQNSLADAPQSTFSALATPTGDISYQSATATTPSSSRNSLAKFASGTGNLLFLGAGTLLPLLEDGPDGKNHALRTFDSALTSTLITEALKHIVREKRPDSNGAHQFPQRPRDGGFCSRHNAKRTIIPNKLCYWYGGRVV